MQGQNSEDSNIFDEEEATKRLREIDELSDQSKPLKSNDSQFYSTVDLSNQNANNTTITSGTRADTSQYTGL